MKQYILFLCCITLISCSSSEEIVPKIEESAVYTVTLSIDWNSMDFPADYPSNAHFSRLIGWSHASGISLFKPGTMASLGIQTMAERGGISPLDQELIDLIEDGKGYEYFIGENLDKGTGDISFELTVTNDYPSMTFATMVAPSPDWYIAAVDVNLFENDSFLDEVSIEAHVYDSGTDSGLSFKSSNNPSVPKEPISLFVEYPLGDGESLNKTIATVTFLKKSSIFQE
jgi:hypothetical protein